MAARQQRQERLGDIQGPVQVDSQVPLERGTIAQVIRDRNTGVVDQDVERLDPADRLLDLRRVGHVQYQAA